MPRLILHIGDGKTGSSFLQHCFAAHRQALAGMGVHYPDDGSISKAAQGLPTAGNAKELGRLLNRPLEEVEHELEAYLAPLFQAANGGDVLVSSEYMQVMRAPNFRRLTGLAGDAGYATMVVYYVRSVAGRAYSGYLQRVKRHREVRSFAEFANEFEYLPPRVVEMLEPILGPSGFIVRNFDLARSSGLFRDFARAVLPAPCASIEVDNRVVNRSLSPSQVAYALELNRYLTNDAQATFAGHALMEASQHEDGVVLSQEEVDILARRNSEGLHSVNRHLPESEHVRLLGPREKVGQPQNFTPSSTETNSIVILAALLRRLYPGN
jgi:hypothetical protein